MQHRVYGIEEQGTGEFDGGTITEQKPIGFPGEGAAVLRLGPLFYWAWASAEKEGYIGMHPHQAFEIMTYVLNGKAHHGDSLGTDSIVGPGGAQLIQAGSGVSHNERIVGPDAELFQIWFEPSIREALQRPPSYSQYTHEQFSSSDQEGISVKTVLGEASPISIVADAQAWDITIAQGLHYEHHLEPNRSVAALAVRGGGSYAVHGEGPVELAHRAFLIASNDSDASQSIKFEARQGDDSIEQRLFLIEVPTTVDYPLYPKRR